MITIAHPEQSSGELKTRSAKDLFDNAHVIFQIFFINLFELLRQVHVIQMGTHKKCLYTEVDRKNTGCNLKITILLDCVLIGVCAVLRLNTVSKCNS